MTANLTDAERMKLQQALLESPAYVPAYEDVDLMRKDELRPVRLYLELVKPEIALAEQNIKSTIVVFGSARTLPADQAEQHLAAAEKQAAEKPDDPAFKARVIQARKQVEQSLYYEMARDFSRMVSCKCQKPEGCELVVVTGGGPGIMEAGNRGAYEAGAKSIGLNIKLPFEQAPNPFITPELCFDFRYFAIRKMHFLLRAKALVAFPGGFGTLDELFEALTLMQTLKVPRMPVILAGKAFWDKIISFPALAVEGVIAPEDLELFEYAESAEEIWTIIRRFFDENKP